MSTGTEAPLNVVPDRPFQAITTKYHGPGNVRGSRVTARAQAGSVSVEWDDALNSDENHRAAARALCAKVGWTDPLAHGVTSDGSHVFVQIPAPEVDPKELLEDIKSWIRDRGFIDGVHYDEESILQSIDKILGAPPAQGKPR